MGRLPKTTSRPASLATLRQLARLRVKRRGADLHRVQLYWVQARHKTLCSASSKAWPSTLHHVTGARGMSRATLSLWWSAWECLGGYTQGAWRSTEAMPGLSPQVQTPARYRPLVRYRHLARHRPLQAPLPGRRPVHQARQCAWRHLLAGECRRRQWCSAWQGLAASPRLLRPVPYWT